MQYVLRSQTVRSHRPTADTILPVPVWLGPGGCTSYKRECFEGAGIGERLFFDYYDNASTDLWVISRMGWLELT